MYLQVEVIQVHENGLTLLYNRLYGVTSTKAVHVQKG